MARTVSHAHVPDWQLAPGMELRDWVKSIKTHLLAGWDPHREGDGGDLNRIGVLSGWREGEDAYTNPQLEKIWQHTQSFWKIILKPSHLMTAAALFDLAIKAHVVIIICLRSISAGLLGYNQQSSIPQPTDYRLYWKDLLFHIHMCLNMQHELFVISSQTGFWDR